MPMLANKVSLKIMAPHFVSTLAKKVPKNISYWDTIFCLEVK